ncbi:hypothetical protein HHI36_013798 [Cryptolaemus montrouzieri]|uniref:Adenomatous polyposis coli protein n=1 Tax=Cryptolaemus montrouzieri TaxID=559131 RepID=A0ABD2NIW0_9CUCU
MTICSPQVSDMRREGKSEANEMFGEDLNRKYDISLSDEMRTCSLSSTSNNRQEINSFTSRNPLDCSNDTSDESNILLKNNPIASPMEPSVPFVHKNLEEQLCITDVTKETLQESLGLTSKDFGGSQMRSDDRNIITVKNQSGENLAEELNKSGLNKSLGQILDVSPEYSYSNSNNCLVFSDKNGDRLERSCNDAAVVLDTRMLDPDAMIESLDRFTAELVSQASSHLQHKDSLYKSSANDNTWDENSSHNEVTFPSISISTPNVISFKSESENDSIAVDKVDAIDQQEAYSNDFSSFNTSTMTDSTLIAMEATKIAAAFKEGADMSLSANSLVSLELDNIQPPSHLNSLSNSIMGLESKPNSPKMTRKKSLPSNIMVRRALNHSITHTSSFESFEHHCMTNSDQAEIGVSSKSIPSLSSEGSSSRKNFIINGPMNKDFPHMSVGKAPSSLLHFMSSSNLHSVTDIDNINPPSMLNEITDMCNSLADVATSAICSETEVFEDCFTHVDNTLQTENDATEFSDANSVTPIQSDVNSSSNENTPKRQKTLSKSLTSKQKRAQAKERYKTYTVAAEMVMKESLMNQKENMCVETDSTLDNFKTATDITQSINDTTYASPTYTVDSKVSKLSPKERRQSEKSRYQTQVLEVSQLQNLHQQNLIQQKETESDASNNSPEPSPSKSKISVRKNFVQRRLLNKERFKTQTLNDSRFSPDLPVCNTPPINDDSDLYQMVEKEANKVLKTLRDTKTNHDELLDCETLSLVSNEDESEHNSGSSVNYRTYHKSWGLRNNIPMITAVDVTAVNDSLGSCENEFDASDSEDEINRVPRKPKIVKPDEKVDKHIEPEQPKGIRGKRKPLYSRSNINKVTPKSIKPSKNMSSNLVKNVTSSLKSTSPKLVNTESNKTVTKPPAHQGKMLKPLSGNSSPQKLIPSSSNVSPRNSPKRTISKPSNDGKQNSPRPLERQGTFTKDESPVTTPQPQLKSKIPSFSSKIPGAASKIPTKSSIPRAGLFKSASSDRNCKVANSKVYNRSTSADSRESGLSRRIQSSLSSHSLKSEPGKMQQNGAIKKAIQNQRSNSNTSLNGSNNTKKQVTSKIASIWKKIEESKKKIPPQNDSKKWIEAQVEPSLETVESEVPRNTDSDNNAPKRISRLGSFIVMDENEDSFRLQVVCGVKNDV